MATTSSTYVQFNVQRRLSSGQGDESFCSALSLQSDAKAEPRRRREDRAHFADAIDSTEEIKSKQWHACWMQRHLPWEVKKQQPATEHERGKVNSAKKAVDIGETCTVTMCYSSPKSDAGHSGVLCAHSIPLRMNPFFSVYSRGDCCFTQTEGAKLTLTICPLMRYQQHDTWMSNKR